MPSPTVEIVIPVYNGAKYIRQCLNSVLSQRYTDFKILISDNNSTDDTFQILKSISDPRITLYSQPQNIGAHENFNFLIHKTKAKYVKFFCADDVMMSWAIERQVAFINQFPEAVICSSDMIVTDQNLFPISEQKFAQGILTREILIKQCCDNISNRVGGPSNMLFRGDVIRGLRFDSRYKYLSDLVITLEACKKGFYINEGYPSYFYRRHESSDTITNCNQKIQQSEWSRFLIENESDNFKSILYALKHAETEELKRKIASKISNFSLKTRLVQKLKNLIF